jgi:hypothetical protein
LKSSIQNSFGTDPKKVSINVLIINVLGFYNVDVNLKDVTGEGLKIMAIGDMNNDKHADIVTVNQ